MNLSDGPDNSVDLPSPDETVGRTTYCFSCGRDLCGERVQEDCPGCGHPIADSYYGDAAVETLPPDVKKLHEACNMVYYPAAFLSTLIVIGLLATLLFAENVIEDVYDLFNVGLFGAMITPAISILGIFVLTRRRSGAYYAAKYGNARFLVKLGIAIALVAAAVVWGMWQNSYAIGALLEVAWFAFPTAFFLRGLQRLMRRVQRKKLARYLRLMVTWTYALGFMALSVLLLRYARHEEREIAGPLVALTWVTVLAGAGFWLVTLRLLYLVRHVLWSIKRKVA